MGEESEIDLMAEINAMKSLADTLDPLEHEVRVRVLSWANSRFGVLPGNPAISTASNLKSNEQGPEADLPTIFDQANPKTTSERALVVGYYLQVVKDEGEFQSQPVNNELKNLGHPIPNVTDAFTKLMQREPKLVLQTRKTGSSRR